MRRSSYYIIRALHGIVLNLFLMIAGAALGVPVAQADSLRLVVASEGELAGTSFAKTFKEMLTKELVEYEISGVELEVQQQGFEAFSTEFLAASTWDISLVPVTSEAIRRRESYASPMLFGVPYLYDNYASLMQSQQEAVGQVALVSLSTDDIVSLGYVNGSFKYAVGSVEGWGLRVTDKDWVFADLKSPPTIKVAETELAKDAWELIASGNNQSSTALLKAVQQGKEDLAAVSVNDTLMTAMPSANPKKDLFVVGDPIGFGVSAVLVRRNWWDDKPYGLRVAITNALQRTTEIMDRSILAEEAVAKRLISRISGGNPIAIPDESIQEIAEVWSVEVPERSRRFILDTVAATLKKKEQAEVIDQEELGFSPAKDVRVDYFTNRAPTAAHRLDVSFSDSVGSDVSCGSVAQIGKAKGGGTVELLANDCSEHFKTLVCGGDKPTLLLVHGFNTNFASAVGAVATLKRKLDLQSILLWSWPAREGGRLVPIPDYIHDKETAGNSAVPLARLLKLVPRECSARLTVLAHSMGGAVALNALNVNATAEGGAAAPGRIVFAAPDVHISTFKSLVPKLRVGVAHDREVILYACAWDAALIASKSMNDEGRAGLVENDDILTTAQLESILVDGKHLFGVPMALNHSYVYADDRVQRDLKNLMSKMPYPAKDRGLKEISKEEGGKYFTLPSEN